MTAPTTTDRTRRDLRREAIEEMLADSRSQLWGRAWSTDDPRQRREAALWLKEQILEMEMRVKLIQEREDEEARRIQAEHRLELQRRAAARNRGFQDASSDY